MIAGTMAAPPAQNNLYKTKQHFEILDGLRGIAALVVVIFHFLEVVYPDYSKNFAGHGFLAVDFFFCLSGFVIAYAYDDRIGKMGVKEFLISRFIRLHPLVILGSVLGLIAFILDPFSPALADYSTGKIILVFLTSLLLIPYPVMADRYFNLFGLNAPAWSLFWEYAANIVYGLFLWKLNKKILMLLAFVAAAWIFYVSHRADNLLGGWGKESFWDGCTRISFSFLAGMLVYRYKFLIKNKLGFAGLGILLLAALLMPFFRQNWLVEALVVTVYFPLLVALGAGAVLSPASHKICVFSGKISYPLYMTHYMVIWIFAGYYNLYKPDNGTLALVIGVGTLILLGFAYLAMQFYDIPVRKYLTNKRKV